MMPVSRAHEKLKFALEKFNVDVSGKVCADFGSSTGGFVQVLLEKGCSKVYSVETSKNRLHFVLKDDERLVVLDNTNAVHVELPEKVDFISIDVGWTKQNLIIPNAVKNLKDDGVIVSLVKPHYESGRSSAYPKLWSKGAKFVEEDELDLIVEKVKKEISEYVKVVSVIESPIVGLKGKNKEFLMLCKKK